jgi:hypothetical protein
VADTKQVVKSSIDDWVDVIGNELIAIEKIKRLEYEKQEIKTTQDICEIIPTDNKLLKSIESQINELKSNLPPILRVAAEDDKESKSTMARTVKWVAERHIEANGLPLKVVAGADYSEDKDAENINLSGDLYLIKGVSDSMDLVDDSGVIVGRVLNPLPIAYDTAAKAIELCYGKDKISVEFDKIIKKYKWRTGENLMHYLVRVKDHPTDSARKLKNTE